MPGYNGLGPAGQGAMTGRGRGLCIVEVSNISTPLPFRGTGLRGGCAVRFRGGRRGHCGRFGQYAMPTQNASTPGVKEENQP